MPYRVQVPDCQCCGCETITGLVACFTCLFSVAYLVGNITVNALVAQSAHAACVDDVLPYSWASLVTVLLMVAQGYFLTVSLNTRGRFNDCRDNTKCSFCCCCIPVVYSDRCCAALIWFVLLATSCLLAGFGTHAVLLAGAFACLPTSLMVLCIFSLTIQYASIVCSLVGLVCRAGCIEYVPPEPHPPPYAS